MRKLPKFEIVETAGVPVVHVRGITSERQLAAFLEGYPNVSLPHQLIVETAGNVSHSFYIQTEGDRATGLNWLGLSLTLAAENARI